MATASEIPDNSMMTGDIKPKKHGMMATDSESESEEHYSLDLLTRHGEQENLELLSEVYHKAMGGDAMQEYSSNLERLRSPMENNVLHLAALYRNDGMVDEVAARYPDLLFSLNRNGDTPLHVAAMAGHISTLRKLLDACADSSNVTRLLELVEMKNKKGNTMLHEAMMSGGGGSSSMASSSNKIFHVLEAFLQEQLSSEYSCYGLALNNVNNKGQSVLYLAVEAGLMEAVNQILDKCPESATPSGISPLEAAIMKRDKEMLTMIVSKKHEWIHLRVKSERLPLHFAASKGYHEGVVYLLDKCKTCSIQRDKYGLLPLHLAARGGHVEVVKELLKYCPNPNEMLDNNDRNILHIAAKSGELEVVRYILKTPALDKMINQKDVFGNTPLHVATFWRREEIVYALIGHKRIDLNVINEGNQTARDVAVANRRKNPSSLREMRVVLRTAGAKTSPAYSEYELMKELEKDFMESYSSAVYSLILISTLIVTASVAACFSVPGGAEGTAHNLHKAMFHFFILCITISFFCSISATIILLPVSVRLSWLGGIKFALKLATPLVGASLITLSMAFMAGVYTVISKLTWLATTFLVMSLIFVVIFCVLCCIAYYIFLVNVR